MVDPARIAAHYARGDLLAGIDAALRASGLAPEAVTVDELAAVDEFHIGGRAATERILDRLAPSATDHVLDIGCGLGGPARFAAHRYGCRVTGIDLTPDFVATGRALAERLGLAERVTLIQGSALEPPFADGAFDAAYMLHVGMNIEDKPRLFQQVHRVLRPGAGFAVYDIMILGDDASEGVVEFPVPWASGPDTSFLRPPRDYVAALQAAGFTVTEQTERRAFALQALERMRAVAAAGGGPPPLGPRLGMGEDAPVKVANMSRGVAEGRIAPVEILARRA